MILPRSPGLDIESAIQIGTDYLAGFDLGFGHGTTEAADDARWLVLEAASVSPVKELSREDLKYCLSPQELERADSYLEKRALQRIPAAYIVGRTWFAGLEFSVDHRVLVPRSPFAEFLQHDCYGLIDTSGMERVLDLCTGSACIAIAAAVAYPHVNVDAADLSADALAVAAENVSKHQLDDRVTLCQGDLFESLNKRYDLIITNPPYVDRQDIDSMPDEFHHEPLMGLAAGANGLDIVERILKQSPDYLSPAGALVCEVGNSAEALQERFPEWPFTWLEFEHGGSGIFFIDREDIVACSQT